MVDRAYAKWTIPGADVGNAYAPLGIEGGIDRSLRKMQALANLLKERAIPLSIVVYPWPTQLVLEDRNSRQVAIWRAFCAKNCKQFINLFPAFFAYKDLHRDWYDELFIHGDVHYTLGGHRLAF